MMVHTTAPLVGWFPIRGSCGQFCVKGEIYHCGEGAIPADHAPAHRNDESPSGYSSADCSPGVPASASPAGAIILGLHPHAKDFAVNGKLSLITVSQPRGSLHQTVPGLSGLSRMSENDSTTERTEAHRKERL